MHRYLLLVMGLLPLTTLAQQKSTPKPAATQTTVLADTLYFDQDWARTLIPEDRKYARLIRHGSDDLPLGTVRNFYYPSWKKQWEGKLLSEDPEIANGLCTSWYETGKVKAKGTYVRGQAQNDYQEWRPDGLLVKCKVHLVEALPTEQAQVHSQLHIGGSQHVFDAALPENTTGLIYRFDIRDEGQPPITWNNAATVASTAMSGGLSLLEVGVSAMQAQANRQRPATAPTQCHYFVTTDRDQANAFLESKGEMPDGSDCLVVTTNTMHEVRPLTALGGARHVYICVNNDNVQTAAIAQVSITALVQECK